MAQRENKYHNVKITVDGIRFDSKAEATRYSELKILEKAGVIRDLHLQPVFELIPAFEKNGKKHRRRVYRADFSYFDTEKGKTIIEDVKGLKTELYKYKKEHFEYLYPHLEITEIFR